jgi:hypothetical protein
MRQAQKGRRTEAGLPPLLFFLESAEENIPQGLKPALVIVALAARLKSCPFKTMVLAEVLLVACCDIPGPKIGTWGTQFSGIDEQLSI